MKMDFRKITICATILLMASPLGFAQGFSFAALDVVSGSGGKASTEALDVVSASGAKSPMGALDVVSGDGSKASFGALDELIGSSTPMDGTVSYGALDAVSASSSAGGKGSMLGALAAVASASAGEYRPGALSFISRSQGGQSYYASGVWESANGFIGQTGAAWLGQMMPAPAWGRITSKFGFRPRFGRMHKGIDIAMTVGDTVAVPLPGVVDRVSYEGGGYGNYVVVKHDNGLETRYAHLSSSLVSPGQPVAANQPIALSGNTGNSTGPHLHFETRVNGTAIDPQTVFDFAGGMMIPRTKQYGSAGYSASTSTGALSEVAKNGIRGRSLAQKRTYVVRAGDTLEKIASRAGVSVQQICRLNFMLETDELKPGTMIRLSK